jgi:AcrR family transcriptional regulator
VTVNAHKPHDERVRQLLDATCAIIVEDGVAAVTLTAIAKRSGVSRQWLYEFFPDLESIYVSLYEEARRDYLHGDNRPDLANTDMAGYLKWEIESYLMMPVACAILGNYALNGGSGDGLQGTLLRTFILDGIVKFWVNPMVELGYQREEIMGSVIVLMTSLFGLIIAIDARLTTLEIARERMHAVIDLAVAGAFQ